MVPSTVLLIFRNSEAITNMHDRVGHDQVLAISLFVSYTHYMYIVGSIPAVNTGSGLCGFTGACG